MNRFCFLLILISIIIYTPVFAQAEDSRALQIEQPPSAYNFDNKWLEISNKPKEEQLDIIKDKVIEYHENIQSKTIEQLSFYDTQRINQQWQERKAELNQEWLTKLFELEDNFRRSLKELNENSQRIVSLQEDEKKYNDEIKILEKSIQRVEDRIQQTREWQESLKDELKSRLESLPINIVLIGRAKLEDIERKILKNIINEKMIRVAVTEVIGSRVRSYSQVRNDELINNFVAKTTEGYAQVSDTYYKDSTKMIDLAYYVFQILRIEVYPFREEENSGMQEASSEVADQSEEVSIEVYAVFDEYSLYPLYPMKEETKEVSFGNLKLQNEKEYILSQNEIAQKVNERIQNQISQYKEQYEKKKNYYENLINNYRKELTDFRTEKSQKEADLMRAKSDIEECRSYEAELQSNYNQSLEKYRQYWQNKIGYINKYVRTGPPETTPKEHLKQMVEDTFEPIHEELKNQFTSETVLIDKAEGNIKKTSKQKVNYKAEITHFQILYLTYYDIAGEANSLLNIAFKIKYSSETIDKKKELPPDSSSPYNINDWQQTTSQIKSPRNMGAAPDNLSRDRSSWRLPLIQELEMLSENGTFQKLGFPIGIYLSSEITRDEYNQIQYKCYNFKNNSILNLYPEEEVYIIWKKK